MGKKNRFYCEYCQINLPNASAHGRKEHHKGRKHIMNYIEYYLPFQDALPPTPPPPRPTPPPTHPPLHHHFPQLHAALPHPYAPQHPYVHYPGYQTAGPAPPPRPPQYAPAPPSAPMLQGASAAAPLPESQSSIALRVPPDAERPASGTYSLALPPQAPR